MKTLQWLVAIFLFSYGGFMVGYLSSHPNPKPVAAVVKEEKSKYNWKAIYEDIKAEKGHFVIGLSGDRKDGSKYALYIVDGDRWYLVCRGNYGRGCGPNQDVYRSIHGWDDSTFWGIQEPPSDKAKFVVVGPDRPVLHEIRISREGEDN